MYFTTTVAVLALFAGSIAVIVWIFVTLLRFIHRIYRSVLYPPPPQKKQAEFDGWHPAHLKRAGQ